MISRLRAKKNKELRVLISESEREIERIKSEDIGTTRGQERRKERLKKEYQYLEDQRAKLHEESDDRLLYDEEFRLKLKSILIFLIIIAVLLIPIVFVSIEALIWYYNTINNF